MSCGKEIIMNEVINENISKNTDQTVNAAPEKKPFAANSAEIAFSFLSYVAAYFYVLLWFNDLGYSDEPRILWRVLPVAAFAACAVLILNRGGRGICLPPARRMGRTPTLPPHSRLPHLVDALAQREASRRRKQPFPPC